MGLRMIVVDFAVQVVETIEHLFFSCTVSYEVWKEQWECVLYTDDHTLGAMN